MEKGNQVCFPNSQESHKVCGVALLLQVDRKSKGKFDKAEELGWSSHRCSGHW
jgi:hypothetical protein